jgi:hypothetical protein
VSVDQNGQAATASSSGVYLSGTSHLTLRSGTLSRNRGSGLWALGGQLSFSNIIAVDNGIDGVTLDNIQQVTMNQTQLLRNGVDGLRTSVAGTPVIDITSATLRANLGSGATVAAGTTTFRASTIDSNGVHGVRVLGRAAVALPWDPIGDPQANQLSVSSVANACLSDERTASAGTTVSVVHATLQGAIVPSQLVAGPADGRPQYRIVSAGNQINFLQ